MFKQQPEKHEELHSQVAPMFKAWQAAKRAREHMEAVLAEELPEWELEEAEKLRQQHKARFGEQMAQLQERHAM